VETKNRILSSYINSHINNPLEADIIKSLFDSLIVMHPQEDSFYQLYADYLMAQKKPLEARAKLLTAIDLAPTNPILWKQLLNVNLNLTDYKAVIETCDKAIAYFPEASEFYFYKGMGNFLSDKFEDAIKSYQKGLLLVDSKNGALLSDFYGQIGDVYQRIGKISLAYEAYDNALKYNEKNIVVLNNYAYYLSIEKKDLRKAEAMSGKCIAIDPNNSTYLDTYAWIYFVQQNFTLAKFYIEQALKSGGDKNEVVVEHYGDILYVSGEIEKGLEQWNLSKQMGNTSDTLRKKIEQKVFIDEPVK
jgi:tetratricopeptide (TPR) repeat protein